jgi:hypothetical protein
MKADSPSMMSLRPKFASVALQEPACYGSAVALIPCPECEKQVSTAADACPHCGYPVARKLSERGERTEKTSPEATSGTPEAKASAVVAKETAPISRYLTWAPNGGAGTSTEGPAGSMDDGPRDHNVAAKFQARNRRNRVLTLLAFLGFACVVAWFAYGRDWSAARKVKEETEAKEKTRRDHGYHCFGEGTSESFCWQGQEECSRRRVDHLRNAAGTTISACFYTSSVFVVTFACKQDPARVCYEARITSGECERARELLLGDFNNVSSCRLDSI